MSIYLLDGALTDVYVLKEGVEKRCLGVYLLPSDTFCTFKLLFTILSVHERGDEESLFWDMGFHRRIRELLLYGYANLRLGIYFGV